MTPSAGGEDDLRKRIRKYVISCQNENGGKWNVLDINDDLLRVVRFLHGMSRDMW
jgi:hypothetical protein